MGGNAISIVHNRFSTLHNLLYCMYVVFLSSSFSTIYHVKIIHTGIQQSGIKNSALSSRCMPYALVGVVKRSRRARRSHRPHVAAFFTRGMLSRGRRTLSWTVGFTQRSVRVVTRTLQTRDALEDVRDTIPLGVATVVIDVRIDAALEVVRELEATAAVPALIVTPFCAGASRNGIPPGVGVTFLPCAAAACTRPVRWCKWETLSVAGDWKAMTLKAAVWVVMSTESGRRFMAAWRKEEVDAARHRQEKREETRL